MERMTRAETQRRDCGVERHHCFMIRQKGVLIRGRRNKDLGIRGLKDLSIGALENRNAWGSECPVPRKKRKGNAQHPPTRPPPLLDFQPLRAPAHGLGLRP